MLETQPADSTCTQAPHLPLGEWTQKSRMSALKEPDTILHDLILTLRQTYSFLLSGSLK